MPVIQEREDEALARLNEVLEAPQPKRGVARRGRQAAAKKAVAKTSQERHEEPVAVAVSIEAADSPDQETAAPAAKKASTRAPRKTAPRSRRPRKSAAASEE